MSNGALVVPVLLGVWAAGACALVTLAGMRVRRFRKMLRQAEQGPGELVASARLLAAKLGCRSVPSLRVTNGRVPPVLWGLGRRAVILLPRGLLDELDDGQRSALLAHELAHFARRDHWTRWFEFAVRCLYWWHPVAWWAGRRLREAEEQCCDAWVVRLLPNPRRYADALLKTVDYLTTARPVPTLATGITLRRSLRPFHRRLTMIIDHQPNPRLTWPARLCLLALAGVVLPASMIAVADDEPTKEPKATATTGNAPPNPASAEEIADDESAPQEENIKTKTFMVPNNINFDAINQFLQSFYILRPKPAVTIRARGGNYEIVVRCTEEQLKAVERAIAAAEGASEVGASNDAVTRQTITVVRAQYVLPQKVAEAFDKFIQQHGEHFEFLVSKVSGAVMQFDVDMMGMGGGMGAGGLGGSPFGARGAFGGRSMMGRAGIPRSADHTSQLTIIATPEVQQFGDFIKALSAVPQSKDRAADDDAPDTLTLTRVHYKLPVISTSTLHKAGRHYGFDPSRFNAPEIRGALLDELLAQDSLPKSLGLGARDILMAVKESNLVPLLLISADEDRLTVTTTEDFQQALGKFIHFLQEHEPKSVPDEKADAHSIQWLPSDDATVQRNVKKAIELLEVAQQCFAASKYEIGRMLAGRAHQRIAEPHTAFSDEPDRNLLELAKGTVAPADESGSGTFDFGQPLALDFGQPFNQAEADTALSKAKPTASRLSELREQERELSALLGAIAEARKEEANRTLLLLAINQFYGDNAGSASLVEMFNKLVELEAEKGVLVRSYGPEHPMVVELQGKIDAYRRSIGLPTGEDAKPLDLLDVYVKALQRQLDMTRKVIESLEKNK